MPRVREIMGWTAESWCRQTGLNPRTFAKRANAAGIEPELAGVLGGKNRMYTTKQCVAIECGDLEAERIRETKENADKLALHNAQKRGELVSTEVVLRIYANLAAIVRQIVKHSSMSEVEKHQLLKNIREVKVSDLLGESEPTDERV